MTVGSSITSNPASVTILATQTGVFSVAAQGRVYGAGISVVSNCGFRRTTGTAISGATSSSYTTPSVVGYNGAQYYATVTRACSGGPLTSSAATLTVTAGNAPPTITTQPVGVDVPAGGTPSFSVVASGTPTLTYQWYTIPAGQTTGNSISGATSSSYTLPSSATTTSNDQDAYYVIVNNNPGQAVSRPPLLP